MKARTIVSFALLPFVFIIALLAPKIVTAIVVGIMASIAAYELLHTTKLIKHPRMLFYSMGAAFLVSLWSFLGCSQAVAIVIVLMFFVLLFTEMMLSGMKIPFSRVSLCFVGGLVIPYLFCSIVRIIALPDGRYFVLVPFAIAFASDSFAYLVGMKFGKHKLAPTISPKKTIEGLIGGLAAAILVMVIYSLVLQFGFGFRVNYIFVVIYAIIGTAAGVFGDLCFSVIKRQTGIKDYGNLIPGHGGIMDRFDSMITVAPLVETLLLLLPMAVKV